MNSDLYRFLSPDGVLIHFSDGDRFMLELFRRKVLEKAGVDRCVDMDNNASTLLAKHLHLASWHELPEFFGQGAFDLVMILGNSLPYVQGWNGEPADREGRLAALKSSLRAVSDVLAAEGKFVFDLAKYEAGKVILESEPWEKDISAVFFDVRHADGLRYWTLGAEHESYTMEGLELTGGLLAGMLCGMGFKRVERVPEELQPDPLFYEAYVAYKK